MYKVDYLRSRSIMGMSEKLCAFTHFPSFSLDVPLRKLEVDRCFQEKINPDDRGRSDSRSKANFVTTWSATPSEGGLTPDGGGTDADVS